MKLRNVTIAVALTLLTSLAQANSITTDVDILDTDPGSVQYVNFNVISAGFFEIWGLGAFTLGANFNPDPEIQLFTSSLSSNNWLSGNDDYSSDLGNFDSLISGINLGIGSYILAVSEFSLSVDEAISGLNEDSITQAGLIRVRIESQDGLAQPALVPEPTPIMLFCSAFLGLFGLLRINSKFFEG